MYIYIGHLSFSMAAVFVLLNVIFSAILYELTDDGRTIFVSATITVVICTTYTRLHRNNPLRLVVTDHDKINRSCRRRRCKKCVHHIHSTRCYVPPTHSPFATVNARNRCRVDMWWWWSVGRPREEMYYTPPPARGGPRPVLKRTYATASL